MDKESLQASIAHFDQCEKYRVEKTLRSGTSETTELVFQIAADGSQSGPYIRKHFLDVELCDLYERIRSAQVKGLREGGLPRVYETGRDASGNFAIIEYVNGENLRHANAADPIATFEAACKAVQVLHEKFDPPIIHRDIKPDNVIAVSGGVVLIDFGAARTYDVEKDHDTHPYATRAYAPPEQFGFAQTDRKSDIYSLGMLLVFLETGKDPDFEIKQAVRLGEEALVVKGISRPAARTIVRACAFDPAIRFNSVSGMLGFLHAEMAAASGVVAVPPRKEGMVATTNPKVSVLAPNAVDVVDVGGCASTADSGNADVQAVAAKGLSPRIREWRAKWDSGTFAVVGIVWDIILLVIWAFFMIVAISMCLGFDERALSIPIWLRFVEYVGIVMSLMTVCGVLLLDWRPIRKIKWLSKLKRRHIVVPIAVVFVLCLMIMLFVS